MIKLLLALFRPLKRIAAALERIARTLEELSLRDRSSSSSLYSMTDGGDPSSGGFIAQSDADFARYEQEEILRARLGQVPLDEDLDDIAEERRR